ncbi:uncharacterized protein LOC123313928 [Coccinella septempunctata]|uniref:uncharacterized protein LOC123313928 n=1 Tax=Coccinella septempunctata TaxID=41139 RepID=UPI001D07A18F|nr:uncharacterized protein LOC123313928 [Coccinella septempunctata]
MAARVFSDHFKKVKDTNLKKLQELKSKYSLLTPSQYNEDFLTNYTDVNIPDEVRMILSLGEKHSFVPDKLPVVNIIKDLEYCIESQQLDSDEKDNIRARSVGIVKNYLTKYQHKKQDILSKKYIRETFEFVKNNQQLVISRSDKGNITVIMSRDEYETEVYKMLDDQNVYLKLQKDPTTKIQNNINKIIKILKENQFISDSEYKNMIKHNSTPPRLYCLRKIHKTTLSLRPIVSCINAPFTNLARYLHNIFIGLLSTSTYSIKNSFSLVESLTDIIVPEDYILISLDVVSLFTNVPLSLVTQLVIKHWNLISCYTVLDKKSFLLLLDTYFESSYFVFNCQFYKQLDGNPMGAPASNSIAEFVMHELFRYIESKLTFRTPLLKFYVDDTIILVPKDKVQHTLDTFNSFHSKIKFTLETEVDGRLPFLDTIIIREGNNLISDWYIKPYNPELQN